MPDTKQCILAIDDTVMQLHALVKILQPKYMVRVAKDGTTGLDFARQYEIDLILLDLIMPGLSGMEVLNALKRSEKTRHIPVIIVSGNTSKEDMERGILEGACDYIKKPFNKETVIRSVELALGMT